MEIWKEMSEYEGLYEASTYGNLRSLNYKKTGKAKNLKPAKDVKGYYRTALTKDGKAKTIKVHRIIAQTFVPNEFNKPQVNHKNGIKDDNRAENLEWNTNSENQIHAVKSGLVKQQSGDKHHRTKYSDEFVLKLQKELIDGGTKRGIARKYGVDRNIFKRKILNGRSII